MSRIQQSFEKQALLLDAYLQKAANLSEDKFHQPATNGGWSVQQVIFHLVIAAEGIIQLMERKVNKSGELQKSDLTATLRSIFLTIMLKLPLKFKAPKVIANTPNDLSYAEVKEKWEAVKQQYIQFISRFPAHMEDKLIFKHPVAGWFNLEQSIQFLGDHIRHHEKQLEALYH